MILDTENGGGDSFLDIFDPPPLMMPKKMGFKWGGSWGWSGPKTHWGMCLVDRIMMMQRRNRHQESREFIVFTQPGRMTIG